MTVPLTDQIAEFERQLQLMKDNYPRLVAEGKITQEQADRRMARFEAGVNSLVELAQIKTGAKQP